MEIFLAVALFFVVISETATIIAIIQLNKKLNKKVEHLENSLNIGLEDILDQLP